MSLLKLMHQLHIENLRKTEPSGQYRKTVSIDFPAAMFAKEHRKRLIF